MGKRLRRSGSRSPFSTSIVDKSILIRRIKSMKLSCSSSPDLIIQRLREQYPDYNRLKLQPFSSRLRKVLQSLRNNSDKTPVVGETSQPSPSFYDGGTDEERASSKKCGREDWHKKQLLHAKSGHLGQWENTIATFSSSSRSSDDSTSTSDDASFDENIEPEFDITKFMLREKYVKQSEQSIKIGVKEKNVEVESVTNEKSMVPMSVKKDSVNENAIRVSPPRISYADRHSDTASSVSGSDGPRFRDLGGMKGIVEELMVKIIVPLCLPELRRRLGVRPISGILLHGPPGCGKTKLAHAIANEAGVPFYKISATEVVSGVSGASEKNIRELFSKAYRTAPSIIFIDEIDVIASKRDNLQREMERRIVTQLMACMDDPCKALGGGVDFDSDFEASNKTSNRASDYVLVIGATNRPDAIDRALRRPGRFDREIALSVPDENARVEILSVLTRNLRLEGNFDLFMLARLTPGFVGADLEALINEAGDLAVKRILDKRRSQLTGDHNEEKFDWWKEPWPPEEIENLSITMSDFEEATKVVQPSTRREGFASIPNIKWEDVGGLDSLRQAFICDIVERIKNPEDYEKFGLDMGVGFLLYGPPGCGKTLIAKALANEAGANFIHIKGPEILNKYVGETEQEVRNIFSRARTCSPCIIFFDEFDALATKRGKEGAWVVDRALNQLLLELDGADKRHGVYVIGATNRLEAIEPACLRPGRFGTLFYVPLPTAGEQVLILKALTRKMPVSSCIDFNALVRRDACMNFSGADLAGLVHEAAKAVIAEKKMCIQQGISYDEPLEIKSRHFEKALEKITPSVSEEQRRYYDILSKTFRA